MHVSVQQRHIDKAKELYAAAVLPMARCCPIALAVCEQFNLEPPEVCVYYHITLTRGYASKQFQATTPEWVIQWMEDFDRTHQASPIEFDVPLYVVEYD